MKCRGDNHIPGGVGPKRADIQCRFSDRNDGSWLCFHRNVCQHCGEVLSQSLTRRCPEYPR